MLLQNINLIADLIDVKILSQKIGFYCINTLYDIFSKSNNNNVKVEIYKFRSFNCFSF